MTKECSIVRDLLPLYLEGMLREDTAAFVQGHLAQCEACQKEWQAMQKETLMPTVNSEEITQHQEEAQALLGLKKKMRHKTFQVVGITALCLVILLTLLYAFPIYHLAKTLPFGGYYNAKELAQLAYVGSAADRALGQGILRQADAAFADLTHTREENEAAYGLLSRYATPVERGAVTESHTLSLWSAHFGEREGCLWVYYSCSTWDAAGNQVSGSKNIPSLWYLEKEDNGQWVVTQIKEHP